MRKLENKLEEGALRWFIGAKGKIFQIFYQSIKEMIEFFQEEVSQKDQTGIFCGMAIGFEAGKIHEIVF